MTDRELMQQALDLLDDINQCSLPPTGIPLPAEIDHVMEALRARLAQPEPEEDGGCQACEGNHCTAKNGCIALDNPIAQPEPEPINYEEWRFNPMTGKLLWDKQPEPEPVAWMTVTMGEVTSMQPHTIAAEMFDGTHQLYTAPPQREWQGLTDEEANELTYASTAEIEAKLKEKNT